MLFENAKGAEKLLQSHEFQLVQKLDRSNYGGIILITPVRMLTVLENIAPTSINVEHSGIAFLLMAGSEAIILLPGSQYLPIVAQYRSGQRVTKREVGLPE